MAEYIPLATAADLEAAIEDSRVRRIAILKHSTTCPISMLAKNRIDLALKNEQLDLPVYYLDLLRYRPISNQIAHDLEVQHESPQLIVVQNGAATFVSTHLEIDPAALRAKS